MRPPPRVLLASLITASYVLGCGQGGEAHGARNSSGGTSAQGGEPALETSAGLDGAGGARTSGGAASASGAVATGGESAPGGAPSGGGTSAESGGSSTSSGATSGGAAGSCELGAQDTAWPSDCAATPRPECVPGTWGIYDPTGSAEMPAVRAESEHFALRWEGTLVSAALSETALTAFEGIWDEVVGRIGFPEPFCERAEKYKVNVHVRSTGGLSGSGVQEVPAMWVEAGWIDNRGVLAHEFTHTLQYASGAFRDSPYVGWMWESQADWMNHQLADHRETLDCAGREPSLANFPHLYYGSTRNRYCNWQFWEFLKDKHCHAAIADLWRKAPKAGDPARLTEDPFSVLARNQGWSESALNDFFGTWALHNATWDYRDPDGADQGAVYRKAWGYSEADLNAGSPPQNRRRRVTRLERLEAETSRYHVPEWWAPERWGYNLVRLYPRAAGDGSVTVRFRGVLQDAPENTNFAPYTDTPRDVPNPDSDWRWGLVAVHATGSPRYSSLQRGSDGELCFQIQGSDRELWLVVTATPQRIHKIRWDQKYFSIYRYPWMVELEGAVPDGFQPGARPLSEDGAAHPNGGGWVSSRARVASTAYVGPKAAVLGGAVSDTARIEDQAIIVDGQVSENAVVGGLTILGGGLRISGNAVLKTTFVSPGTFETGQSLSGTVQVLGDVELRGANLSLDRGVYYGYVEASHASAPEHGANQSAPMTEVTRTTPFVWRP